MDRDDWNCLRDACLEYGIISLIAVAVAALFLANQANALWNMPPFTGAWVQTVPIAAAAAMFVFLTRHRKRSTGDRLSLPAELGLCAVAGLGLYLPVVGAGVLLATSGYAYDGIEKWLPGGDQISEPQRIQRAVSALELGQEVHERVVELIEESRDKGLMRGRDFDEMLAATVYVAAREQQQPRTLAEISDVTGVDKKRIGRSYRYLGRNLDVRVVPPRPQDYLDYFADKLALDEAVQQRAAELIDDAAGTGLLSGKSSKAIAATALYVAARMAGEERTIKEVAETLDVTPITVRTRAEDFASEMEQVPEDVVTSSEK